ncbi:MAG: phenylalanine--tRNA ligase subunit beta, partial [Terriglobia bacterium]
RTEASHRFERGADIEIAPLALDRAATLIKELAGGEILRGMIDVYPQPKRREKLNLRRSEIRRILGAEIPWEDVERTLRLLGFAVERRGIEAWGVTPPSFRLDVAREVDLIEEVARHFGYDRLSARLLPGPPRAERDHLREKELALSQTLVSLGYREIITSSMVDPEEGKQFSDATPITIENPLSQEASALRTTMIPSMINALRWNLDRDAEDLQFFEMGKIYWRDFGSKPQEHRVLVLGLTGHSRPATVYDTSSQDELRRRFSFLDIKGDLELLLARFDLGVSRFQTEADGSFESGQCGRFICGGRNLVTLGQLRQTLQRDYKLRPPVWLAVIDLEGLLEFELKPKSFRPFSKFPRVDRDLSLMVPSDVSYSHIAEKIENINLTTLHSFRPMEYFRPVFIGPGKYSLLLRVTFQSHDHTLSGEEIAALSQKVLDALAPLGARLRG